MQKLEKIFYICTVMGVKRLKIIFSVLKGHKVNLKKQYISAVGKSHVILKLINGVINPWNRIQVHTLR